jgi:DNA-binding PadR family transcriptional regulator
MKPRGSFSRKNACNALTTLDGPSELQQSCEFVTGGPKAGHQYSFVSYSETCYSWPMRPFLLSRDTFHILVALADRDRHGYSIMQEVSERTGGEIRLSPSTLYSAIKRLLEQGFIEELEERPDPEHDDERRRYYRLTKAGKRAAMEEARHLEKLLSDARASGLVRKRA